MTTLQLFSGEFESVPTATSWYLAGKKGVRQIVLDFASKARYATF